MEHAAEPIPVPETIAAASPTTPGDHPVAESAPANPPAPPPRQRLRRDGSPWPSWLPAPLPEEIRRQARELYLSGHSLRATARQTGLSFNTIASWARREDWRAQRLHTPSEEATNSSVHTAETETAHARDVPADGPPPDTAHTGECVHAPAPARVGGASTVDREPAEGQPIAPAALSRPPGTVSVAEFYRMKAGAGRSSSPLDEIRPARWTADMSQELLELLWVLETSVEAYPELKEIFGAVLASETFRADELPQPTPRERQPPTADTEEPQGELAV